MSLTRDQAITKARALWARTASTNEHERDTAKSMLTKFLQRHHLSMADLGSIPAKGALPAPASSPQDFARAYGAGPRSTTPQQPSSEAWARDFETALNQMFRQGSVGGNFGTWCSIPFHFSSPDFDALNANTVEPIDRYRDRLNEPGSRYDMHWFTQWSIGAVIGYAAGANHVFAGLYGKKWNQVLAMAAPFHTSVDLLNSQLKTQRGDYILKLVEYPYPAVTERNTEDVREHDWIELNPQDFAHFGNIAPDRLAQILNAVVSAARQAERKHYTGR